MRPYDGFCNPLPADPYTVIKGFASIDKHPDRAHEHESYKIRNVDWSLERNQIPAGNLSNHVGGGMMNQVLDSVCLPQL